MAENKATIVIDANAAQAIAEMDRAKKAAERMQKGVSGGGSSGGGMASSVNRATRSMQRFGNESKKATKGAADGLLQMAYFADDVQYGMRGILNNIPGLVMGFGASAKMAGLLSIVVLGTAKVLDGSVARWGESLADFFSKEDEAMAAMQKRVIEETDARQKAMEARVDMLQEEMRAQERMADIQREITEAILEQKSAMRDVATEREKLGTDLMRTRVERAIQATQDASPAMRIDLMEMMGDLDMESLATEQKSRMDNLKQDADAAFGELFDFMMRIEEVRGNVKKIAETLGDLDAPEVKDAEKQLKILEEQQQIYELRLKNAEQLRDETEKLFSTEKQITEENRMQSRQQMAETLGKEGGGISDALKSMATQFEFPLTSLQQIGGERAASPYGLGGDIARQQLNKLTEINQSIQRLRAGYN